MRNDLFVLLAVVRLVRARRAVSLASLEATLAARAPLRRLAILHTLRRLAARGLLANRDGEVALTFAGLALAAACRETDARHARGRRPRAGNPRRAA